ncbi:hypothetical protein D3C81_1568780 [compost metagenome]
MPAIDSTLKLNTAPSTISFGTTGGPLMIALSRPGTGNLYCQMPSTSFLNSGMPQTNTNTVRMTHGIHALTTEIPTDAALAAASASRASG